MTELSVRDRDVAERRKKLKPNTAAEIVIIEEVPHEQQKQNSGSDGTDQGK